jgi:hypothetical protein
VKSYSTGESGSIIGATIIIINNSSWKNNKKDIITNTTNTNTTNKFIITMQQGLMRLNLQEGDDTHQFETVF